MNIFVLHQDPCAIATHYCDLHLRKMLIEHVQMLSNVFPERLAPYKRTHYEHPCSKWVRESARNWEWLNTLTWSMGWEYFNRFGKRHKSCEVREKLCLLNHYRYLPNEDLTTWSQVMPDEFKIEGNPILAYRKYYAAKLREFRARSICKFTRK